MKNNLLRLIIVLFSTLLFSQVGINTPTPHTKSVLEIVSKNDNQGVLFPRLTTSEIIAIAPAVGDMVVDGLWVYNTDDHCYWYWAADPRNEWLKLCGISVIGIPAGTATINCGASTTNGTVTSGNTVSGVTVTVPYTSGNGGSYPAQNINSTGVTGLTATLAAGNFNTGNGNLVFTLSGTPSSSGDASFAVNMGGSNCTVMVNVNNGLATIECINANQSGSLVSGVAASGVTVTVPYNSGNGGPYPAQNINSTGITGLTATLAAGNFNTGNGNLVFTLSGTPSSSGNASFPVNIGGTNCTFTVTVDPATPPPAVYSSCSITPQGNYIVKTPLTTANKLVVTLNVTQAGRIKLVSQDKNGIKFESDEVTLATGSQQVTMNSVTASSGTYPLTSEESSNGANGANNQTGVYTITNTITSTNLMCTATIDVKPLLINGTRVGPIQRIVGNLSGGTSYGSGFISSSSLSNSLASDGIIAPDLSPKLTGEYRFWNSHIRNVSGSSIVVDFTTRSSTVEDNPTFIPYVRTGHTLSSNATLGSIDPYAQGGTSGNTSPTTFDNYGAYGGGAYWSELNDVGVLVQYQGKWYKYRMILKLHYLAGNTYGNDFQTHLVLYGIYNTKPSMYQPETPSNTTAVSGDVPYNTQSYWP